MSNEEFKKNIKTISNNDLLEQVEFMSDGYYFELVDVCLEELRCRLEATRWHYPSKGELPQMGMYLVAVNVDGEIDLCIAQYLGNLPGHSKDEKWYTYHERLKGYNTPIAWMPLPEPPKEEA